MKGFQNALKRLLRGPRVSGFLESLGIDPRRFWLLVDLFDQLSDRGEMLDQLGRNGVALRTVAWLYGFLSAFFSILMIAGWRPALVTYSLSFLGLTAFLLLSVLLSEAGNSLVNPEEGLVLAHQPVNGATYTAAKLTHLVRIILYLVPGMNAVPALAGLMLKESRWFYPLFHMALALAVGLIAASLCCALYGWLMRFIPACGLKAAGQFAGTIPFLGVMLGLSIRRWLPPSHVLVWLPSQAAVRWGLGLAVVAAAIASVVLGIRSLSADYLIRVSSMMHSGWSKGGSTRRSRTGDLVARLFGGQPARAGFAFVCRMMRRDFQFRRQVILIVIVGLGNVVRMLVSGRRRDPFSGQFTAVHLLPHLLGFVLFLVCSVLAYGSDFKGVWIFLLAPAEVFGRFARGVWAALCLQAIVVPHAIIFFSLAWLWGVPHAALFVAYSVVVSSTYLALELRLIEGMPFSSQVDASRSAALLPAMILGGVVMAVAVAIQFFIVFRGPAMVASSTAVVGAVAYFLTRRSLAAFAASMRFHLGLLSAESGTLYKEINV